LRLIDHHIDFDFVRTKLKDFYSDPRTVQESNLFQEIFEEIVEQCVQAGLVNGPHISVGR